MLLQGTCWHMNGTFKGPGFFLQFNLESNDSFLLLFSGVCRPGELMLVISLCTGIDVRQRAETSW